MSNDTSHKVHGGYFALPFDAGTGITYDSANPSALHGRAVTTADNREVDLAGDGDRVTGAIVVVEPTDGQSVKCTVQMGTAVRFVNPEGADPVTAGGGIVGAADGGIRNAASDGTEDGVARGEVTSIEDDGSIIVVF